MFSSSTVDDLKKKLMSYVWISCSTDLCLLNSKSYFIAEVLKFLICALEHVNKLNYIFERIIFFSVALISLLLSFE